MPEPEAKKMADENLAAVVHHSGGSYPVVAGWGILDDLGRRFVDLDLKGPAYIITDTNVMNPYGRQAQLALQKHGIAAHIFIIPAGETSKSFSLVQSIYDWLVERRAERGHPIIAVGGGVVGDLAGFVAATFLRGVPFVQVPTSMAAMVDASIGGKVAVNLPQAKNLVGAFYQPRGVFADVQALSTLGKRELAEGWAEAIKHGFILDADLVDTFEQHAEALMDVEAEISTQVIRRSMAIKAEVVSQDERETLGIRILLNYGHTIGHALEASTEYGRLVFPRRGSVRGDDGRGAHGRADGNDIVRIGGPPIRALAPVQPTYRRRWSRHRWDIPSHVHGQEDGGGFQPLGDAGGGGQSGGLPGRPA